MTTTQIVAGSLAAITANRGASLAESFLHVDVLLIVDTSGSMGMRDAPGGRSRYQAACDELTKLQKQMPGKIGVVSFSGNAEFCPSGIPTFMGANTDMARALQFVKLTDGCGIRLILISDGQPDSESETLKIASAFKSRIDTIYIGPEVGASGPDFLRRLAATSGGQYSKSEAIGMLAEPVMKLLAAG